jgi:hypothetical protein
VFNAEDVYPEYLSDWDSLVCPSNAAGSTALELWDNGKTSSPLWLNIAGFSDNGIVEPCEVTGGPYSYYGYALSNGLFATPADFANFQLAVEGLEDLIENVDPGAVDNDWFLEDIGAAPVPVNGIDTVLRLREGVERFFITDINSAAGSAQAQSTLIVMFDGVADDPLDFNHLPAVRMCSIWTGMCPF